MLLVFAIILLSYILEFPLNCNKSMQLESKLPQQQPQPDIKFILFWTPFFNYPWPMKKETLTELDLKTLGCPISNCVLTQKKDYLDSESRYDAFIFHSARNWFKNNAKPSVRSPNQLYIMSSLECPSEFQHDLKKEKKFYNLTMSYRFDSDILWHYGNVEDKETGQIIAPNYNPLWRGVDEEVNLGESHLK